MKDKPRFKVAVRQDPEDHSAWLANVVGAPGAQTFGRSLAEAKRHGIEVVALWFELEPEDFEIDWDMRLGKLAMPVLAIGADKSFGTAMADALRFVASDVTGQVIANSGHWLMEEQPAATVAAITGFLAK